MSSGAKSFLPWWAWIIVAIEIAVPALFATMNVINPAMFDGNQVMSETQALYVTRNYTMALGVLVAVLLRTHAGLFIAVLVRYATDFVDVVSGLLNPNPEMLQIIVVLFIPLLVLPLFLMFHLWKRMRQTG